MNRGVNNILISWRFQTQFDITVNDQPLGRIVYELWDDVAPMAARNFRKMATGELGIGYKGSKFYAVQKEFLIAGGVKGSTFSKSFKCTLLLSFIV